MQSTYECPLCGEQATESTAIYSHLMTHHRKSTISRELMAAVEKPTPQA